MDATLQEHLELLRYELVSVGGLHIGVEWTRRIDSYLSAPHHDRGANDDGRMVEIESLHREVGAYLPISLLVADPGLQPARL